MFIQCGRSSGVERNLAKVDVEGSNPFTRSKKQADQKVGFFVSERREEEPEKRVRSRSVSEVDVRQDSPLGRGQKSEQSLHPLQLLRCFKDYPEHLFLFLHKKNCTVQRFLSCF